MSADYEEDDYMSDKFLQGSVENDIRPGLPKVAKEKRAHEIYKKKISSAPKKKGTNERLRLEEGLNTAISNQNKGFKMLEKMGYQPGMSLGKSNEGIKEPINVLADLNSTSLHPEKKPKIYPKIDNAARDKHLQDSQRDYRKAQALKSSRMLLLSYYNKARSACYNLDQANGIEFPEEEYYWPRSVIDALKKKEVEEDSEISSEEEIDEDVSNNIVALSIYMRSKYYFCVFCGSQFENLQTLEEYCPSPAMEDHDL